MAAQKLAHLIDRLPPARGTITADAPIARLTWFRVGGNAECLFEPADQTDLQEFLNGLPSDIDVTVFGGASNLIVRDGGIPGVTIRLGRAFSDISNDGDIVTASAGAMDITVARSARDWGIGGLEFLSGVPGSIGGAIRMNAGAYGSEIQDILLDATAIDRSGGIHAVTSNDLGYSYRHSTAPDDWIFLSATLQGRLEESPAAPTAAQPRAQLVWQPRSLGRHEGGRCLTA